MPFLPKHNQEEVSKALDMAERLIGFKKFKRLFGVILADRSRSSWTTAPSRKAARRETRAAACTTATQ